MVRIWERWLEERDSPTHIPAILPLVVYHGDQAWDVATDLMELIDLPPDALRAARPHLPGFAFALDDLSTQDDAALRAREGPPLAKAAWLLLKRLRHAADPMAVVRSQLDLLGLVRAQPGGETGFLVLLRYVLLVTDVEGSALAEVVARELGEEAREAVMTTGEKLIQEGELRGQRRVLVRLLSTKFGADLPEEIRSRVEQASPNDLDTWTERVLTAASLNEVFAPAE